jgi:hypothetical protein
MRSVMKEFNRGEGGRRNNEKESINIEKIY